MGDRWAAVNTAHLADACVRLGIAVRCGPAGIGPSEPGGRVCGRVLPTRHVGSVDVFLEAFERARPGDVLVVDNGGRADESCVGDLVVLEARAAGVSGIVIWGLHRDSADIRAIGLPVFSTGSLPTGPRRLDDRPGDALTSAEVGPWTVTTADLVVGDDDGVLFLPSDRAGAVLDVAEGVRDTERRQAGLIRQGRTLREQVRFREFLATPGITFREHLRAVGGAVEE